MRVLVSHRTALWEAAREDVEGLVTGLLQCGHEAVAVTAPELLPGHAEAPLAVWRLWRAHRRLRPDLIYERHAPSLRAGSLVARRTGTALFLELTAPPATAADRAAIRAAARIVVAGAALRDAVAATGVDPGRIEMVSPGVPLERFVPVRRPMHPRPLVLGAFGPLTDVPALDALVGGVARTPGLEMVVMDDGSADDGSGDDGHGDDGHGDDGHGAGPLLDEAIARGCGDRLRIVGRTDPALLPALVGAIDVAVVLRPGRPGLLAAMAAGCAVVAWSGLDECPLLVHERTALLASPGDAAALWAAVLRLAADPDLRRAFGEAGRAELVRLDLTWRGRAARIAALHAAAVAGAEGSASQ